MRIALVTYALQIGGVESVLLSLAEYFKGHNHEVEFIETSSKGEWSDEFKNKGFKVTSLLINLFETRIQHTKKISSYLNNFDVIYLNDSPYAQASISLLNNNIKIFPILHNNIESMIKNAISNYDAWNNLICVSPSLKTLLDVRYPNLQTKINTITNGVKVENYNFKKKFDYMSIKVFKILYVGRIEHDQKGVLHIPDIAKLLNEKKINFEISIIGNGPSEDALREKVNNLHLSSQIKILGRKNHEEVVQIMKKNHFFIMPSYYEGHPIVLMEAMSFGLITFVTNLPGHTDIVIKDDFNGYLCDIENIKTFVEKIELAIKSPNKLNNLSDNAWNTIFNKFNQNKLGADYLSLLNNAYLKIDRRKNIDLSILGDFPNIPNLLMKPYRKILKITGKYKG